MTTSPLSASVALQTGSDSCCRSIRLRSNSDPTANSSLADDKKTLDAGRVEEEEGKSSVDGLTAKERDIVARLQRIDRQVRAHEQAHLAAAGGLARGVSYQFRTGPDGRRYAVSGEVAIDAGAVEGDPQATIRKAQQVRAAANAPANPSPQDRAVAAQAAAMETRARQELLTERREALQLQIQAARARSFEWNENIKPRGNLDVRG